MISGEDLPSIEPQSPMTDDFKPAFPEQLQASNGTAPDHSTELILAKLDLITQRLDNIERRLQTIEQLAKESK
ncbi:hypothetical protein HZB00_03645 [Candidatus Woesearchaeota archaeon]|nr:hypothetical protein [Candidatus Woesearchaeota archaeon]